MLAATPNGHAPPRNGPHPHAFQAGAAYRSAPPPPPEFTLPLLPPHLEVRPKMEGEQLLREDGQDEERGVSDAGRLQIDSSTGALDVARSLAAGDEPTRWYWTFDGDGKPVLTRFNPHRVSSNDVSTSPPPPEASTSATPGSARLLFPPHGNRGFKLRSPSSSLQPSAASSSRYQLTSAIPPDDELIVSQSPRWNAFGRLAPWTSGMTGPLTGQGEEEVGPQAWLGGDEGEVGERRPRRGDRETNDRLRLRIAALQRAGVRSLLTSPPPRHQDLPEVPAPSQRRRSSSPLLPPSIDEPLSSLRTTSALAPTLLQPVLSPLQLLESRTLKHTFRNPHIEALAKTTLDLAESEGQVRKAVGGFWAALEEEDGLRGGREKLKRKRDKEHAKQHGTDADGIESGGARPAPPQRKRSRNRLRSNYSPDIVGAAGSSKGRSKDELNPTFVRLEELFITHEDGGLRIPLTAEESEMDESGASGANVVPPSATAAATNGSTSAPEGKTGNEVAKAEIDNGTAVDAAVDDSDGAAAVVATAEEKSAEAPATGAAGEDSGASATTVPAAGTDAPAPITSESQPQEGGATANEAAEAAVTSGSPKLEVPPQASELAATSSEPLSAPAVAEAPQGEDASMSIDAPPASAPASGPGAADEAPVPAASDADVNADAGAPPASAAEASEVPLPGRASASPSPSAAPAPAAGAGAGAAPSSMLLPPSSQREIMLAALSCLSDLEADSREYASRLEELRGRLAAVGRRRGQVWRALRIWAVRRVEKEWEEREKVGAEGGAEGEQGEGERGGLGSEM